MFDLLGTAVDIVLGQFLAILLLVFGLFLILAGIFTAYFGSGKSRTIGVTLLVVGLVVGLLVGYLYSAGNWPNASPHHLGDLLLGSFLVILAAVIGALIAIGIFLVAIMKS
jgi:hypothetical protein